MLLGKLSRIRRLTLLYLSKGEAMTKDLSAQDIDKLKMQIKRKGEENAREFKKYIEDGSEYYNCRLVAVPTISKDGRITAVISIEPKG